MEQITKVYDNEIGISFKWQKNATFIQIMFRDIGFYLTIQEIKLFFNLVQKSKENVVCHDCKLGKNCKSMLLKTPSSKVSITVSLNELNQIEDLLKGTLFQANLNIYLSEAFKI